MTTPVRRYWIPATALSTLGWSEGDVELVQAKDFDALQQQLDAAVAALAEARYRIESGRVWNGMGWKMTGLNTHAQTQAWTAIDNFERTHLPNKRNACTMQTIEGPST